MSTLGKITRRAFLIGSTALAGGVLFGYYQYKKPHVNPLLEALKSGEAAITPYVLITPEGITLITPRADKGQGAYSIQAYLLAEELDVDPLHVKVSPGKPNPAYFNGVALEEAVPFAATDDSWLAERMRGFTQVPAKLMGVQITGGSSTVKDSFFKLRYAGAVARETLKQAAAQVGKLSREQLKTENGYVIFPDGKKLSYQELAPVAAQLEPITEVSLRPEAQWRYLGKPMRRIDTVAKSTGTQVYGIDQRMEGLLYASVRANPAIGAGVKSVDEQAAKSMKGVKKIVPIQNGVAVIADNTWRAFKAVNALKIEWEKADYPESSAAMWQVLQNSLNADHQDSRNKDEGNIEQVLAEGDYLEAEYRIPYLAHAPLEPMNATVRVTDDRVEIWTGTQIPRQVQQHAAKLTGVPEEHVHVYVQMMGGSFGRCLEDSHVMQAVEIAMSMKGTPIKMTWTREEDMTHDYPRPMQLSRARGKVKSGKVHAYDLSIVSASVMASSMPRMMDIDAFGPDSMIVAGAWDQPFAIPNYRVTGYRAPEMVPISSWRSVGASGNGFLHSGFLDELMAAADVDPLEELIRLCNHTVSRKVLEEVGNLSGWSGRKIAENRGRGVAFVLSFGVPTAEVVEVTQTPQGIRIDKVFAVADVGKVLDPINFEAQLAGGALFGLGHAMNCELTYENQAPTQTNFHQYPALRMNQSPVVVVKGLENGEHIKGIGEPGVPPAAPALANAIFAATGQRIRELPLNRHVKFV